MRRVRSGDAKNFPYCQGKPAFYIDSHHAICTIIFYSEIHQTGSRQTFRGIKILYINIKGDLATATLCSSGGRDFRYSFPISRLRNIFPQRATLEETLLNIKRNHWSLEPSSIPDLIYAKSQTTDLPTRIHEAWLCKGFPCSGLSKRDIKLRCAAKSLLCCSKRSKRSVIGPMVGMH